MNVSRRGWPVETGRRLERIGVELCSSGGEQFPMMLSRRFAARDRSEDGDERRVDNEDQLGFGLYSVSWGVDEGNEEEEEERERQWLGFYYLSHQFSSVHHSRGSVPGNQFLGGKWGIFQPFERK